MIKRILAIALSVTTIGLAINVGAYNLDGYSYPRVFINGRYNEEISTMVRYDGDTICVPMEITISALGGKEEVKEQNDISTEENGEQNGTNEGVDGTNEVAVENVNMHEFSFHLLSLKMDVDSGKIEVSSPLSSYDIESGVLWIGGAEYIKLTALDSTLTVDYSNFEKKNKINIRDVMPSSIEYDGKTWNKTSDSKTELGTKAELVDTTKNGLGIYKVRKYILWIIPFGHEVYMCSTNNETYYRYNKIKAE